MHRGVWARVHPHLAFVITEDARPPLVPSKPLEDPARAAGRRDLAHERPPHIGIESTVLRARASVCCGHVTSVALCVALSRHHQCWHRQLRQHTTTAAATTAAVLYRRQRVCGEWAARGVYGRGTARGQA